MASLYTPRSKGRFHDLPLAVKSIAGFWLFYFLTILARSAMMGGDMSELLTRRAILILIGIALTFIVYLTLRLFAERGSLRRMVIIAALACLPVSILFSAFNFAAFVYYPPSVVHVKTRTTEDGTIISQSSTGEMRVRQRGQAEPIVIPSLNPREMMVHAAPRFIADSTVTWYFFFAAWASFYVAMSSANQLRLAERRAAEFERAAQSAQLRALRYQVNPHFLFNTLNSLSSLIMTRRDDEAERMIMNLSNFFRSSLSIDPTADVSLAEEIALQRLYLDIEKTRFPNRLHVEVDIPDRLQSARVPALLLQPVVENVIKYGVARAKDVVTLTIRAEEQVARLRLIVENSGEVVTPEVSAEPGTGVGLANVRERLIARFGDRTTCEYGPRPEGGYRVELTMPLVRDG